MNSLDRYMLRQLGTPLIFSIVVITMVVWLTQSLQRIELVIDHGEGWAAFLWLTLLLIPSLLIVVIPFAVFGAALFTLQKFHADSELAVMFAAGVSKLRLASPILAVACVGALFTLWINLDLMPQSYRELKKQVAEIRADLASVILRAGEFTKFGDGFTVYIEETLSDGGFRGLVVNDYRGGAKEETYMARYGRLTETDDGPILYLFDGNVQTKSKDNGEVDIVLFDQTALNISGYKPDTRQVDLELTERYLSELLRPDMSKAWDREYAGRLIAEGHARLSSPFYPFAYVLLAVYGLMGGQYSRRGYGLRLVLVCLAAGGLRIAAFVAQSAAAENDAFWMLYAIPIAPSILLMFLLSDIGRGGFFVKAGLKRSSPMPQGA